MAKFEIKINSKNLEKVLKYQVNEIVKDKQKEIFINQNKESSSMNILSQNAETMLEVFTEKYKKSKDYTISGNMEEFPEHLKLSIKGTMETLKNNEYISSYNIYIGGEWYVILTPEALQYFEKKGSRVELFEELAENEKELLRDIIQIENDNGNISGFLREKVDRDEKDIIRGIIGVLKSNGLINVSWGSNTVNNAVLTQAGRTYFEREKKYNEKLERLNSKNIYNNINAMNSTVFLGNVIDSTINIDNSISRIEHEIEKKCDNETDKKELLELLEEAKEILGNIKDSKHIDKRKGFFQKITNHFDKHGWFYAEIVGLFGETVIKLLGGI